MNQNNQSNLANKTACHPELIKRFVLSDLAEAELSGIELVQLEDHLGDCLECQALLELETADSESWNEAALSLGSESEEFAWDNDQPNESNRGEYISKMILKSLAPSDDPEMLGRIGPYEVSGVIGQGGMGVVFKAHDRSLNRPVALKVLRPFLAISGAARQRFFREARAAATINHDNVMPIHSVGESSSELPYLVMPYVGGVSLQQRIAESGPLKTVEITRIGMQIASGLSAAHEQGLVHRDIKPANIILEDGVDKLWITDFGLARLIDDASLTRTGVIAGTPEYMSPEQARGESVDERSDLFSLGSLMYAMATGHPPFRAETSYGVLRRITDDEPRSVREINPDVPGWLEGLIERLLCKDPEGRVGSSSEISSLLKESLAHLQHPAAFELPEKVRKLATDSNKPASGLWRGFGWVTAAILLIACGWYGANQLLPKVLNVADSNPVEAKTSGAFGVNAVLAQSGQPSAQAAPTKKSSTEVPSTKVVPTDAGELAQENRLSTVQILPGNTPIWFSIKDPKQFEKNFGKTQIGSLLKSDPMKPFVDQFNLDIQKFMGEKGLPVLADIFKQDWVSGEVSVGFVELPGGKNREERLSPVAIIDVSGNEQAAFVGLMNVFRKRPKGGHGDAVKDFKAPDNSVDIWPVKGGMEVCTISFDGALKGRMLCHGVSEGRMVVGTNLGVVVDLLNRAKAKKVDCLGNDPSFKKAMSRTRLDVKPDIIWFAKPLAVAELLMHPDPTQPKDGTLDVLHREGFEVFTGVGGRIAFATDDHEMIHRSFVCHSEGERVKAKPGKFVERADRANVLGLFDFSNKLAPPLTPPAWVPHDASSCLVVDWNKSSALKSFGPIYDALIGERGSFDRLLNDFKIDPDMQLDLVKLAAQLDHRSAMVWYPNKPGEAKTEHPVIGLKINGDPKFVLDSVGRATGGNQFMILGHKGIVVEGQAETKVAPGFDSEFDWPEEEDAAADATEEIESRYFVLAEKQLLVSNNKKLIKRLLEKKSKLIEADDYIQVHAALGKLTDAKKVSIRHFGRLDVSLQYHYELFRKGEFEWFKWIERKQDPKDAAGGLRPKPKRFPQFDGSKLPKDFAKQIAPQLGTFGWVLETEDDGWMITGCVLKKK